MNQKKSTRKNKDIAMVLVVLAILILLNFIGSFLFKRFDLTTEKRYTLSESTKKLLKSLDDVVYIKVYLQGDFNPNFTRLKNETKEILDEFRAYSNNNLEYELINPLDNPNKEETDKLEKQLYDKGLMPEQIVDRSTQKVSETFVWQYLNAVIYLLIHQDSHRVLRLGLAEMFLCFVLVGVMHCS